ncbi:MAG TPA: tRNA-modifying protein YgfZ, partial [Gammaproteobacteria bacterium]
DWEYLDNPEVAALTLPGSAGTRVLLAGPAHALAAYQPGEAHASGWIMEDVRTGIPWIGSSLSEEFLPQELDLETLGGLSYTKGCFPGQEIIQRVHSRGRLKRSLRRFCIAASAPFPAARILAADGTAQGIVIVATDSGNGSGAGLAVVDIESAERTPLHVETGDLLEFDAARQR